MAKIAVIGASGLVGNKLVQILADKLPQHTIVLCGNNSVGNKIEVGGKSWTVQPIEAASNCDYATFMTDDKVSQQYLPQFAQKGIVCIDNSAAFRLTKGVPLVVPQVNGQTVGCSKAIANPNCTTIQIAITLSALTEFGPRHVNAVTMQSASGAGREGLLDLTERRSYGKLKSFPHPIFDNVLPKIGEALPDGTTTEERKIVSELPKILQLNCPISAFCTRVPISVGHCALVQVKFDSPPSITAVREAFKRTPNVLLFDDTPHNVYPTPQVLRNTHFVGVGRIFIDEEDTLNFFTVADNLLTGAAYNAYKILEISLKNNGDWI